MKKILILIVFCVLAFIIFSFRITQVPPGINGDEVGIARNAALISKNLTDENNNFLPLFVFAKGSDWKQPVTVYATSLVFKIFGISFAALRITSVLFIILSLIILFFIAKEGFGFKFFIVSSLVLISTPIIMMQAHLALENIAPLPFILFWLLMILKYQKSKKSIFMFLAGASLGIGVFSYLGMRLIVPILSLTTLIFLHKSFKQMFYFLLGVLPFFVLLYIANSYYPGAVVGNFSAPIPSMYDFGLRYLSVFDVSFLFLKGDITSYHSTGKAGMFLISTLPLFLLGIWKVIKNKKPFEMLVLYSFFLAPILFGLIPEFYRASRLIALIPFYVIISTLGFFDLSRKAKIVVSILVIINYLFFVSDYWFSYPDRVVKNFPYTINYYDENFIKKQ